MAWYNWFGIFSLAICLAVCLYHVIRLIKLGMPVEYSGRSGSPVSGIVYSFTSAMNPSVKESASLNLPVYIAGIVYHLGTFIAGILFMTVIAGLSPSGYHLLFFAFFLFISALSGTGILIKRLTDKKLLYISLPDDYISNVLVTFFQASGGVFLLLPGSEPVFMISAGLMMLYLPVGKLRHAIYFFAARFHLGFFYGWRNVWPLHKQKVDERSK